jgi:predicted chitinase
MAVETQTQESGIDPKIAKLLGLDFTADLDREDYISLLKEKMMAGRMSGTEMSSEDTEAITDEFKKVKKDKQTKFNVKKTTIKPDAFFDKKKPDEQDPGQKALPGSAIVKGGAIVKPSDIKPPEKEEEKDTKLLPGNDILKDILRGVNSILGTLQNQNKFKKKQSEKDRKSTEKKKRGAQEDKLEKGALATFASGAKKLLKPVTNFFADILKFIGTVLIGRLLVKIIDWMSDDENKEKLTAIGDFFKNTWPILLAAYLLFGNSFGRFAVKLIKVVGGFVFKLASKIIPALFGAARKFGFGKSAALVGTAVGGVMLAGRMMDGGEDDKDLTQPDGKQKTPPPDKPAVDGKDGTDGTKPADGKDGADGKDKSEPPSVSGRFDMAAGQGYINDKPVTLEEYQSFTNMSAKEKAQKYGAPSMKGGGKVPGSGPNKDTVPAMLAPGEFVMSRGAVSKYGADTLASMNAAGGGTNLPKRMNGVTHAVGGGLMGDMSSYGYGDESSLGDKPSSSVEKPHTENKQEPKKPAKGSLNPGDMLGGIATGVKNMFGFGGGPVNNEKKDDKDAPKQSETKEDSSSGGGGFNESSLKAAMDKAGYTDPTERAMFLAQMAHESGNFRYDEEIHDGSNYEGRSDLGNTQPGDGKRYKGRGYIQLTGRANYTHYGKKLGVDLAGKPELAKRPDIAADVAVAYWKERVDREAARKGDVRTVTRNINGGYNGLQDRIDKFKKYSGNPNYTAPGGGLIASSSSSGSGELTSDSGGGSSGGSSGGKMSAEEMSDLFSGYKTIKKVNAGPSLLDLYNEQERFAGRPEGFKPGGLKFKKPPSSTSSTSGLEINSRSTINMQQKSAEGAGSMGNQSNASPNPSATNVAPSNDLPEIDANAMISQEKIKVLGITVV